jgi:hypothetical protein
MSILKQVLTEAVGSLFRKSPADDVGARAATTPRSGENSGPGMPLRAPRTSAPGVKVVILNWKGGENDPFTVINDTIRQHFHACGKNVEVLEVTDPDWTKRLTQLATTGVSFAFTWQGVGSTAKIGDRGEGLWDHLKIPLICMHGDHPSHMPLNHQLESRYCFHLYTNADFARYSNRHFRRARSAGVIDIPQLHSESRLARRMGEHFVFAKNINDPDDTETRWQEQLPKPMFDSYMIAAETLKSIVTRGPYVEIHDVLDDLLIQHGWEHLGPDSHMDQYHHYHSALDHYLRSYKSVAIVSALREFPVRIYGRGWDRLARRAPALHVFEPGRTMADSQELYYTRFGLIDVSPSKRLHDRTRRAMVNGCGFLSSANLEDSFADIGRFDSLFFSLRPNELSDKCAAVVNDPDGHHAIAQQFAHLYHDTFHFRNFVNHLDQLALASTS